MFVLDVIKKNKEKIQKSRERYQILTEEEREKLKSKG